MVNLDDRKFLQELRYKAIARAHNTPNLSQVWEEAYEDLAQAADKLDAMLARKVIIEEKEG